MVRKGVVDQTGRAVIPRSCYEAWRLWKKAARDYTHTVLQSTLVESEGCQGASAFQTRDGCNSFETTQKGIAMQKVLEDNEKEI